MSGFKMEDFNKIDRSQIDFAAYGTLRLGNGNWSHFLDEEVPVVMLGDTISGYYMVTTGWIPMVVKSDNPDDKVVVDVFNLDGRDTKAKAVHMLEIGAGYDLEFATTDSGLPVYLYVYSQESIDRYARGFTRIESGDYNEYIRERRN